MNPRLEEYKGFASYLSFNTFFKVSIIFFFMNLYSAEICGINRQENYHPVFRSQTEKILVSFDGRMVCLEILVSVLSYCSLNLWSCAGLGTYFLLF